MKKILKATMNVTIYAAIVIGAVYGLPKFLAWYLDTPYPMAAITSGSMWPELKEGDLIFIEGVAREELAVEDVVVYRNHGGGTFTIHRIVELREDELVTKGDANFNRDNPIAYEDVVGRAVTVKGRYARLPHLGAITVMANSIR
jgi:signal peptidase I